MKVSPPPCNKGNFNLSPAPLSWHFSYLIPPIWFPAPLLIIIAQSLKVFTPMQISYSDHVTTQMLDVR